MQTLSEVFLGSLHGYAQMWFGRLHPESIHSFSELFLDFVQYYTIGITAPKRSDSLLQVSKHENEMLKDYAEKFETAMLMVSDMDWRTTLVAFLVGLPSNHDLQTPIALSDIENYQDAKILLLRAIPMEQDIKAQKTPTWQIHKEFLWPQEGIR